MRLADIRTRLDRMSGTASVAIVVSGYFAALFVAVLVAALYDRLISGPDTDASSGMAAFGEGMLFLYALGVGCIPPSALAFYFIRKHRVVWQVIAWLGIGIASTGSIAVAVLSGSIDDRGIGSMLAVPRIFLAPLLGGFFALAALLADDRIGRRLLLGAAVVECVTAGYGFVHWFVPMLRH